MVSIIKNTDTHIKLRFYDDYMTKNPIDLKSIYIDFICAVTTATKRLLIEKKYSKNNISVDTDNTEYPPYIINVEIKQKDTVNLNALPSDEGCEPHVLEIFGIFPNGDVKRIYKADFYIEESGYYVRSRWRN